MTQVWIHSAVWYPSTEESDNAESAAEVAKAVSTVSKKWVFQLERGEEKGRLHYQIYMNLKNKQRPKKLGKILNDLGLPGVMVTPSSELGKMALKAYCMKDETRVSGPWADRPLAPKTCLKSLQPWQAKIEHMVTKTEPHPRVIYWFFDEVGGVGKSTFANHMEDQHGVTQLGFANASDTLNLVSKLPPARCYFFDLPRTKGGKTSMSDVYEALESVKNGRFNNTKYETSRHVMAVPHVVVFSNWMPDTKAMSMDRWKIVNMKKFPRIDYKIPDAVDF